jgi:hypothetical protein
MGEELAAYHAHFAPLFARREQRAWAEVYLRGLLTADVRRKNVEAMTLRLLGAGPDAARQVRALASRNGYRAGLPGPEVWVLIRRPLPVPGRTKAPELKYSLSNAAADIPLAELLRVCGMRWPIECCFEEGKGELGMDQYELRFWRGWSHHMTLVILAHHFLVRLHQRLMARSAPPPAATPAGREGDLQAPGD